jgi:hypothetical protein
MHAVSAAIELPDSIDGFGAVQRPFPWICGFVSAKAPASATLSRHRESLLSILLLSRIFTFQALTPARACGCFTRNIFFRHWDPIRPSLILLQGKALLFGHTSLIDIQAFGLRPPNERGLP